MVIREDAWLGRLIGYPVHRVEDLRHTDASSVAQLALHVTARPTRAMYYTKVDAADVEAVRALSALGFYVVDVNVTLGLEPGECAPASVPTDVVVADCDQVSAPDVLQIAGSAMRFSRFHLDPAIAVGTAHQIKREWIENYLRGDRGDALLVARVADRVAGFLAVLASDAAGRCVRIIDLIAVDATFRRRGVGRALVAAFIDRYRSSSDLLQVGTQIANTPSLALYQNLGFRIRSAAYVLHLHTPASIGEPA